MSILMEPIGFVRTDGKKPPRHWSLSDMEGELVIDKKYTKGLKDIKAGQRIVVIFNFHESSEFNRKFLVQTPPHRNKAMGIFSICSPYRPNPIGMSVLKVLDIKENIIKVKGLDMLDKTPVLDIKPHIEVKHDCLSFKEE
ncbi:MAG: tRNA (N6-threonylcarbamoyladenosine(37)-N6)-methyltransferase TrmO [Deltaproteobacteria bacterium]|nr:tRNA (N6-threonylcarbamoyladenosine(37)-N6)-methyltransferase TrmO [Deltaproteobacteria bacterium]